MKTLQGIITGLNTKNTAKVHVSRLWKHPMYQKSVVRSKNYACHYTDDMKLTVGDTVEITESKPISKTKKFVVSAVITQK
jgi:small subunit ribosomal protein S17